MSKMSALHQQMTEEIGEDATEEEIDLWFEKYCREHFFPESVEDENIK